MMRRTALSAREAPARSDDRAAELTLRAHRARRKGQYRRALVALREACALDEHHAPRWLWLADVLARLGKRDEAERAMKQSLYLRQQSGEKSKANVVRGLLLQLGRVAH
jgi:Flp pilus assembly protein TadD